MILKPTLKTLIGDLYSKERLLRDQKAVADKYPLVKRPTPAEMVTMNAIEAIRQQIAQEPNR
jgi:hypothetical protein